MKVAQVGSGFLSNFRSAFPNIKVLEDSDTELDLIVFTGGSDVTPFLYKRDAHHTSMYDWKRDYYELGVLQKIFSGELKVGKILGICRGSQFLNVAMGGSLYENLDDDGKAHGYLHEIYWEHPTRFSFLDVVNSTHHQAVRTIGDGLLYKVMAREPHTNIVESVCWDNFILTFQFHPEDFGELSDSKKRFFDIINDWVDDKYNVHKNIEISHWSNPIHDSIRYGSGKAQYLAHQMESMAARLKMKMEKGKNPGLFPFQNVEVDIDEDIDEEEDW